MKKPSKKENILVVDDAADTREVIQRNLTSRGYRVFTTSVVTGALKILGSTQIDLVITDLKMPGSSGLDLIRHINENLKNIEVIMITGYPSVDSAVKAVKNGAEEYLAKPFTDGELFSAVKRALDKLRIKKSAQVVSFSKLSNPQGFVGESKAMQKVLRAITKAVTTSAIVLITGESGTGKELVARAIHYSSRRASAPFVPVNCGAIPENLLESELFGHVKGAFTGANETRAGFFQTADKGTIFLDEISETSVSMQIKLLRVLEDQEIYMVGSSRPQKVDVRILASTNKDLPAAVKKELFREDLYFRLNVIAIEIPPLRERDDDILILIHYFANNFAQELGKTALDFSDDALQTLKNYHWPGNVREVKNVIRRLVVMAESNRIGIPDLPTLMRFSALKTSGLNRTLAEIEAEHISHVLTHTKGNKTEAAKILGIDRKTLRDKLAKIEPGSPVAP